MQEKNRGSGQRWLVLLLLFITGCALGVTVWTLCFRQQSYLPPDYAPMETEPYGEPADKPQGDLPQAPAQGGAVRLTYSDAVTVVLGENRASLYFANPQGSNQDAVLQLILQDTLVCRSGLLPAGMQVQRLDLADGIAQRLSPGGYKGTLQVHFYHQETGEKAPVHTEIPVYITVIP